MAVIRSVGLSTLGVLVGTMGACGADDTGGGERVATSKSRYAAAPPNVTVERAVWNAELEAFLSDIDNPSIQRGGVGFTEVSFPAPNPGTFTPYVESGPVLAPNGITMPGVDWYYTAFHFDQTGAGVAHPSTRMSDQGSVSDRQVAWPPTDVTWWAPTNIDIMFRGARVGYTNLGVQMLTEKVSTLEADPSKFAVRLKPTVGLVPVEVVVMRSPNFPMTNVTRDQQLAFWDQVATTPFTSRVVDGDGRFTSLSVQFPDWVYEVQQPRGLYLNEGLDAYTPDSAWSWVGEQGGRACGVQFRLVNFFYKDTDDKHVSAQRALQGEPETPQKFVYETFDDQPCYQNASAIRDDPRHRPGTVVIVFMQRVGFPTAPEIGRALPGLDSACVPALSNPYPNIIAHELGHLGGLPDTTSCPAGNQMMCSGGAGGPYPNLQQCQVMESWAQGRSSFFARP